jgi:glycolate oxidase FAD binding subunit
VNEVQANKLEADVARMLGADRVRPPSAGEAGAANLVAEPLDADQIGEIVRFCEAERIPLAPLGAARTLGEIRRAPVALGVSLARMDRVVSYEPEDMTVIAEAGLTLGALNRRLERHGQRLPLDPCDPDLTSLGAMVGAAHCGPLRLSEGTPRDLLIGVRFVGHQGRCVHGGGRVVKNVAGYDLMKVMTGSFGTLGIITETAFKLRPIPEGYTLALAPFERAADAFETALKLNDELPLVHVEVLSPALATRLGRADGTLLIAAVAGSRPEVEYQRNRLKSLGGVIFEEGTRALELYRGLRDLGFPAADLVAQIATVPAALGEFVASAGTEFAAHAASGIVRLFFGRGLDAAQAGEILARWRGAARRARGHLRLLAAAPALRHELEYFDQPAPGALTLMRRMKAAFDPARIFNPGCFVGNL